MLCLWISSAVAYGFGPRCTMDDVDESAYLAGYWHAMADVEFGPYLIEGCPTSVFATIDLEGLWGETSSLPRGLPRRVIRRVCGVPTTVKTLTSSPLICRPPPPCQGCRLPASTGRSCAVRSEPPCDAPGVAASTTVASQGMSRYSRHGGGPADGALYAVPHFEVRPFAIAVAGPPDY